MSQRSLRVQNELAGKIYLIGARMCNQVETFLPKQVVPDMLRELFPFAHGNLWPIWPRWPIVAGNYWEWENFVMKRRVVRNCQDQIFQILVCFCCVGECRVSRNSRLMISGESQSSKARCSLLFVGRNNLASGKCL